MHGFYLLYTAFEGHLAQQVAVEVVLPMTEVGWQFARSTPTERSSMTSQHCLPLPEPRCNTIAFATALEELLWLHGHSALQMSGNEAIEQGANWTTGSRFRLLAHDYNCIEPGSKKKTAIAC